MLRSRLFTPAFRFFAALAAAALVGAFVVGVGSADQGFIDTITGPLSLGWKGAVGNHLGYTVLVALGVVAAALAGIHIAFRDADPEAGAELVHTESVPLTRAPSGSNHLPILGVFAVGIVIVGQITNIFVTLAGFGVAFVVLCVWAMRAWAERATGDPEVNRQIYQRFIEPFRVPVLSAVCVAVVVLGFSRVLLAVSQVGAVAVLGVVASIVLLVAAVVAARPAITKNLLTILVFVGAVALIAAGIIAAVVGERDIQPHSTDHAAVVVVLDGGPAAPAPADLAGPEA